MGRINLFWWFWTRRAVSLQAVLEVTAFIVDSQLSSRGGSLSMSRRKAEPLTLKTFCEVCLLCLRLSRAHF